MRRELTRVSLSGLCPGYLALGASGRFAGLLGGAQRMGPGQGPGLAPSALGVMSSGFEKEVVARLEAVGDGRGPGNT